MWSHLIEIFAGYEIETLNELVAYTPAGGTVVDYEVSVGGPPQSVFTATVTGSGIEVKNVGDNLRGLYPIKLVRWEQEDLIEDTGDSWDDIPLGATMTRFEPHETKEFIFPVTCTCNWLTADPIPVEMVDTVVLPVRIWQHYDVNQQLLLEKVSEEIL